MAVHGNVSVRRLLRKTRARVVVRLRASKPEGRTQRCNRSFVKDEGRRDWLNGVAFQIVLSITAFTTTGTECPAEKYERDRDPHLHSPHPTGLTCPPHRDHHGLPGHLAPIHHDSPVPTKNTPRRKIVGGDCGTPFESRRVTTGRRKRQPGATSSLRDQHRSRGQPRSALHRRPGAPLS